MKAISKMTVMDEPDHMALPKAEQSANNLRHWHIHINIPSIFAEAPDR